MSEEQPEYQIIACPKSRTCPTPDACAAGPRCMSSYVEGAGDAGGDLGPILAQQRELIAELEHALLGALPFVEDAEDEAFVRGYKKAPVTKVRRQIDAALTRAKEYTND